MTQWKLSAYLVQRNPEVAETERWCFGDRRTCARLCLDARSATTSSCVFNIWLSDKGYPVNVICTIMDVSSQSISCWKKNVLLHGTFTPTPGPIQGRLKLLNANQMHDLFTLLEESPDLNMDEIQTWIAVHHDLLISISAL